MNHVSNNNPQVVESEKTAKWQYTRHCEDLSVEIKKLREEVFIPKNAKKKTICLWIMKCSISCSRWRRSGDCCPSDSFWDPTGAMSIDNVTIVLTVYSQAQGWVLIKSHVPCVGFNLRQCWWWYVNNLSRRIILDHIWAWH